MLESVYTDAARESLSSALVASVPPAASPRKVQVRFDLIGRYAGTHGVQLDDGWHAPVNEALYRAVLADRDRVYRETGRTWFTLVLTHVVGEGFSVTANFEEPPFVPGGVRPDMFAAEAAQKPTEFVPAWFPVELRGGGLSMNSFGTAAPVALAPLVAAGASEPVVAAVVPVPVSVSPESEVVEESEAVEAEVVEPETVAEPEVVEPELLPDTEAAPVPAVEADVDTIPAPVPLEPFGETAEFVPEDDELDEELETQLDTGDAPAHDGYADTNAATDAHTAPANPEAAHDDTAPNPAAPAALDLIETQPFSEPALAASHNNSNPNAASAPASPSAPEAPAGSAEPFAPPVVLAPPMPLPADIAADQQRLSATTQTMAQNLLQDILSTGAGTDFNQVCFIATVVGDTVYAAKLQLSHPDGSFTYVPAPHTALVTLQHFRLIMSAQPTAHWNTLVLTVQPATNAADFKFSDVGTYLAGNDIPAAEFARDLELYPRERPAYFPAV